MNLTEEALVKLQKLVDACEAPWKLISSSRTTTGTVILHDANGVAIADLYTAGPAQPCDKLIAVAPTVIGDLIAEVRRLRALPAPPAAKEDSRGR